MADSQKTNLKRAEVMGSNLLKEQLRKDSALVKSREQIVQRLKKKPNQIVETQQMIKAAFARDNEIDLLLEEMIEENERLRGVIKE